MEPDESFWRLVEPIWDKVSIYDGANVFLREYARISDKQKVLFSTFWAQSEIGNGGLRQFFCNSTGVLAPEAVQGFRVLGMNQCASIIEEAMMFFVSPYPRHRNIRNRELDRYEAENDPDLNPFVSLDERFFDLIFEEAGGFSSVADAFANEGNG